MTVTHHETEIVADPTVPLIRITREFDATPNQVFRAHTDPDLVVRWLAPFDYEMGIDEWDCRDGGSYRYHHLDGGAEHAFRGCFHLVRPSEVIVQTFTYEGEPDGVALERLVLVDLGNGRTRLEATSLVETFEGRDAFLASGMEDGIRDCYRRLDALLAPQERDQ